MKIIFQNFYFPFLLAIPILYFLNTLSLRFSIFKKEKNISYLGGLGLSISFIIAYSVFDYISKISLPPQIVWLIYFSFIILVVEFIDDLIDFPLKVKVIAQLILIYIFLVFGKRINIYFLPSWLNYVLSFLWIMGITNAFNHLDIKDGLCAGISLIISLAFFLINFLKHDFLLAALFMCLAGSIAGFLIFNFPPARIFMGNSGSHFLGFLFATLSLQQDYATLKNPLSLIAPLLILAFPIIDTTYLIFARLKKRIVPLRKSDDHIFLSFLIKGNSHKRMLSIMYAVTILWCLSGVTVVNGFNYYFLIFVILSSFLSLVTILKANHPKKDQNPPL